jgi:hypothetical protein
VSGSPARARLLRRLGCICALTLLVPAAGCDRINRFAGGPSVTGLPSNLPPHEPGERVVALCYNKDTATMEDLVAAALEQCLEPGSTVEYLTGDLHINDCPLLKKRRAVFVCRDPADLRKPRR